MPRHATLVAAALATVATACSAPAALAQEGFAPGPVIEAPAPGQVATGVDADGRAVVAGTTRGTPGSLLVATREAHASAWTTTALDDDAVQVRDVQATVGRGGVAVVVWAHLTRGGGELRVAEALPGATPRTRQRLVLGNAYSASPRLAVLRDGSVLLAYRDAPRGRTSRVVVRRLRAGGTSGFGPARTVGTGVAGVALAPAGGGAVVAWTAPYRKGRTRVAWSRRLGADGAPRESTYVITHDAGGSLRVSGGPDGRSIASWMRPGTADRRPAAFTRSLRPVLRPARPLGAPGLTPAAPATLALGPDGTALAALRTFGDNPFGFSVLAARSRFGGVWASARELGPRSAMAGTPQAVLLPGGAEVVLWTTARMQVGTPVYDVNVTGPSGTTSLGTTTAGDGRGLTVAQAGGRVLVAWPTDGGIALAER